MTSIQCQACGKKLNVPEDKIGGQGRCPACGKTITLNVINETEPAQPTGTERRLRRLERKNHFLWAALVFVLIIACVGPFIRSSESAMETTEIEKNRKISILLKEFNELEEFKKQIQVEQQRTKGALTKITELQKKNELQKTLAAAKQRELQKKNELQKTLAAAKQRVVIERRKLQLAKERFGLLRKEDQLQMRRIANRYKTGGISAKNVAEARLVVSVFGQGLLSEMLVDQLHLILRSEMTWKPRAEMLFEASGGKEVFKSFGVGENSKKP